MRTHSFSMPYTPSQISCLIATHQPNWRVCFLNNDHANTHQAVIGICPKMAWTVMFDDGLICHEYRRDKDKDVAVYPITYQAFEQQLIEYSNQFVGTGSNHQHHHHEQCHHEQYHHGLMGFISYDISAYALNPQTTLKKNQPCAYMGHYDVYLKMDNDDWVLTAIDGDECFFENIKRALADILSKKLPTPVPVLFMPVWTKSQYDDAFNKIQQYIKAGDTYQINLTQPWQADVNDLSGYLPTLQHKMNAPFAGFLKLADFDILSVSPELFFTFYQKGADIHIITKPIKGTRPRHDEKTQDDLLKHQLANSQKDISENLMIVDLLRNDLGKYAKIGTVKTPKRFAIESFKNVHHMVSTISAQLQDTHPLTVLFGSLPAGSITGTPKKRACEIIDELENAPRGAYCGTMGYLNFNGTGQWNVLIRTLQRTGNTAELWAGGGITIGSDGDDEYQECLDKVGAMMGLMAGR